MTDYFAGDSRTNRERMLAGDLYIADDPDSARESRRAIELQARYAAEYVRDDVAARSILQDLLGHLGEDAHIRAPLFVDYGSYLRVGARTFVNYHLTALDVAPITIGEDCQLGPNVQLLTPTHPVEPGPRRDRLEAARPITIGDNVWIGGGAIVLPGVSIGDNTVVGAGAVVTRDLPANVVRSATRPASSGSCNVPAAGSTTRRRADPGRRDRILGAALDVVADYGVAGTSHRRVAERAGVQLGSMTYHFQGMNALLHEAFTRFAEESSDRFRDRLRGATTTEQARQAVIDLIAVQDASDARDLVITHELYTLAARDPAFRDITSAWMARDRATFEAYFDPTTSRLLNALIEGLVLHRALDTRPHDPRMAVEGVDRIVRGARRRVQLGHDSFREQR